ncbi:MAG TPA: glutathione transferase [Kofleriaceae bacterium]|nr:glutathione transferase [Kofleriaceae bacterium]
MLTLYGDALWESPYVFSAFVSLREKRLEFETKTFDLDRGEHRQPSFTEPTITGKVPALEHDGFWLTESLAIVEYLEERFPAPQHPAILPSSVEDRARARQLLGWLRFGTDLLRAERPTSSIYFEPVRTPLSQRARANADALVRFTERLLSPGATALFSTWTVCDAELALMLRRLLANGDAVPERIRAYADAVWARPSVRAYVERERPSRSH